MLAAISVKSDSQCQSALALHIESKTMDYFVQVIHAVTRINELLTRGSFESCNNYEAATSSSFVHGRHKIGIAAHENCRIENATERTDN